MKKSVWKWMGEMAAAVFGALLCLAALALLWGFAVEPRLLTVTNIDIADARLPQEMDGTRVVFFSDLHVGSSFSEAETECVAKKIEDLKPDMLLFGGDLTQQEKPGHEPDGRRVSAAFAAIKPRWGKYAVFGNHDEWPGEVKEFARGILSDAGFTVLENSEAKVAEGFYVAGARPWPLHQEQGKQNPDDEAGMTWAARHGLFSLLIAHEPAQIDDNAKAPFALQLSGHTHGGQVALPGGIPLASTYGTENYFAGRYDVNCVPLFVSRGVGTVKYHIRLFAPPEIVVVTLRRK